MRQTTFMQIFSDLHGAISDGTLLPGMPLPSENTLAQQYSTSRPTVRKAIKMLSEQSLIVRKQGIGSVVAEKKQEKPLIFGLDLELQSSSYHYYQKIIKGISSVAESGKHKLQIISLESDLAAAAEGVDGFILSHIRNDQEKFNEFAKLAGQGTPVVLINRFPVNPELSYISVDYRKEMFRTVNCLLRNGARNVLLYAPFSCKEPQFVSRIEGWRQAYRENGLAVPELLVFDDDSPEDGERFLRQLKSGGTDVLFVSQGDEFFQAMQAVVAADLRVPEDISIFCFDDMEFLSDRMGIPLSFIKKPLEKMGRLAAEYLIRKNRDRTSLPIHLVFETSLVINGCKFLP